MFARNLAVACFALIAVGLGLATAGAFSQEEESAAPPKAPANAAAPQIHYHYHTHIHSLPSWMYPGYSGGFTPGRALTSFPQSSSVPPPTAANPNPAGYVPGPYAPLPFANRDPRAPADEGVIHVFLPVADAVVYLNGQKMRGSGKDRQFTTPILPAGQTYQYYVTAKYKQDGQPVTEYRKVVLVAGSYEVADFTRPSLYDPGRFPTGPVDPNDVVPEE